MANRIDNLLNMLIVSKETLNYTLDQLICVKYSTHENHLPVLWLSNLNVY